jgi:hypothetical protein
VVRYCASERGSLRSGTAMQCHRVDTRDKRGHDGVVALGFLSG